MTLPLLSSAANLAEIRAQVKSRPAAAATAAETLVKAEPKNGDAWIVLTEARVRAGKYEKAIEAGERATALAPANAQSFYWLGNAYGNRIGQVGMLSKMTMAPKLRDAFEMAVKLDPALIDARESLIEFYLQAPSAMGGGIDKARVQATTIGRQDKVKGLLAQARIARHEKKPAQALKAYEEAYALRPDDAVRIMLIIGYQDAKRWQDAYALIAKWIASDPVSNNAQYQLGRLAAISGRYLPEGETALRKYLGMPRGKDDPEPKHARYRLGQVLAHAGRKDAARTELQAALKLDSGFREAREALSGL